jgi:uncharacterized protein (TIGR02996 family)
VRRAGRGDEVKSIRQPLPDGPEYDAFVAKVVAELSDPAPKLVFADWLDDRGFADLAFAYRWCGRRGKYPTEVVQFGTEYRWRSETKSRKAPETSPEAIPWVLFDRMATGRGTYQQFNYRYFPDPLSPIVALVEPLRYVRSVVECG